jgi:hypothetical protein
MNYRPYQDSLNELVAVDHGLLVSRLNSLPEGDEAGLIGGFLGRKNSIIITS